MSPTFAAAESLVANEIDGESVVLNLATGRYFGLNEVAAAIWGWMQEPRTVEDLIGLVTSEFDVGVDVARADVEALLGQMTERGLVVEGS